MTASFTETFLGIVAGLRAPATLRGAGVRALVAPHRLPAAPAGAWPANAIAAGCATVRLLARLRIPGRPWRNTCLFRSAVACDLLRRRGFPARLRIGVASDGERGAGIAAHAWVEIDGRPAPIDAGYGGYLPLEPAG